MEIIGNQFLVSFRMAKGILHFLSDTKMHFTITEMEGKPMAIEETVAIQMTELRPLLYMVTWKEASGKMISQVQDYEKGILYSNWASPDGTFLHEQATLVQLTESA